MAKKKGARKAARRAVSQTMPRAAIVEAVIEYDRNKDTRPEAILLDVVADDGPAVAAVVDADNDGRAERTEITKASYTTGEPLEQTTAVNLDDDKALDQTETASNPSQDGTAELETVVITDDKGSAEAELQVEDSNNDGVADRLKAHVEDDDGQGSASVEVSLHPDGSQSKAEMVDYDGDGQPDRLVFEAVNPDGLVTSAVEYDNLTSDLQGAIDDVGGFQGKGKGEDGPDNALAEAGELVAQPIQGEMAEVSGDFLDAAGDAQRVSFANIEAHDRQVAKQGRETGTGGGSPARRNILKDVAKSSRYQMKSGRDKPGQKKKGMPAEIKRFARNAGGKR